MPHVTITQRNPAPPPKRRRTRRPLTVLGLVPEKRTADAMEDRSAAEELMNDLLALVDAGLIRPVCQDGAVRYAPVDSDDRAA